MDVKKELLHFYEQAKHNANIEVALEVLDRIHCIEREEREAEKCNIAQNVSTQTQGQG